MNALPVNLLAAVAALTLVPTVAAAAPRSAPLRVCADPNNLPFSNARGEGLENRLAELLAEELGRTVAWVWRAQRRGFFREGLGDRTCDAVMGAPAGFELALTTRPYYRSTYVFVTRRGGPDVSSLDDPRLARLRIGVQVPGDGEGGTPPALALARRGLADRLRGYSLYSDYREPDPPARVLDALARGDLDVAAVWGPLAAWYAARARVPLVVRPLAEREDAGLPMTFGIAVAVRRGDGALRDALDAALERRRPDVERLLARYGVPRAEAP